MPLNEETKPELIIVFLVIRLFPGGEELIYRFYQFQGNPKFNLKYIRIQIYGILLT